MQLNFELRIDQEYSTRENISKSIVWHIWKLTCTNTSADKQWKKQFKNYAIMNMR